MKRILLIALGALLVFNPARAADPSAAAVPVAEVAAEVLGPRTLSDLIVLELYSSLSCTFCPKADQLLGDLVQSKNVIGLSCYVDYFDADQTILARPFCTDRQSAYEQKLRAGPNYTPQMIINGHYDTIGYNLKNISEIAGKVRGSGPQKIEISKTEGDGFNVVFPTLAVELPAPLEVSIVVIDKPHKVAIKDGPNQGQSNTYYNVASGIEPLEPWDGAAKTLPIEKDIGKEQQGFIILAADQATGQILAAGQYKTEK
jgi:hypothetical protein